MGVPNKRIKLTKWIHGSLCAVRVQVEGIILEGDADEPSLEPPTLRLLDTLQRLADQGDVAALERYGEVFVRKSA